MGFRNWAISIPKLGKILVIIMGFTNAFVIELVRLNFGGLLTGSYAKVSRLILNITHQQYFLGLRPLPGPSFTILALIPAA